MISPNSKYAISTLSELLKQTSPESLAFFVTPNTILTLCGARAVCDGVFYHNDQNVLREWANEMRGSLKTLQTITDIYFATAKKTKSAMGDDCAVYDVLLSKELETTLANTSFIKNKDIPKLTKQKLSGKQLVEKMYTMLKENKQLKLFNTENLYHIIYGILLGYPDKAIISSVNSWQQNDPFLEPLISADIRGASYYGCPQPIYSYPRSLVNDPDIKTHEQLWSKILKDYYTSDFHKSLEANSRFNKKIHQLGMKI